MSEQRLTFANHRGLRLGARLTMPDDAPRAWALLAHCFTCSKDLPAARHITQELAAAGIAALRFDFTGLGESEGEFADTTLSSNVDDLVAAARYLETESGQGPALLVGHSLGGTAVLQAAERIGACRAVATVNTPCDPEHLSRLLTSSYPEIDCEGQAQVRLGGRAFTIHKAFLDDLGQVRMEQTIAGLGRALLVLHAPADDVVSIDHAARIFEAAHHPKSFVSLDTADHLLRRVADARYAGRVIAAWASRYVVDSERNGPKPDETADPVLVHLGGEHYRTAIRAGGHQLVADEPPDAGGTGAGPGPYELLLAALGSCTAMTLRMYADRKGWDLAAVRVALQHEKIHARDCQDCETKVGRIDRIQRDIELGGELDARQRARLLEIADRCPVHRTLTGQIEVITREGDDPQ